jgi:PHD/YefM family antitoxin component YafN of YafNO toxin-antitoxin module
MNLSLSEDIVSVTDFARGTKKHLAQMNRLRRPRVLTQNGRAAAVVMPVKAFEEMSRELEEHRLDLELQKTLEAYARGERGTPGPQAMEELRKRAFKRRSAK